jgi:catechol 2,3-dioxygenase-like lactoylglutathione lyase family enzyme
MEIKRIVPDLTVSDPARSAAFYAAVLGLDPVMDQGWVATVAAPGRPQLQLTFLSADATAPVQPEVSIEVDDLDGALDAARAAGAEIVHGPVDEDWGVRRFFLRDPDGHIVNVVRHR